MTEPIQNLDELDSGLRELARAIQRTRAHVAELRLTEPESVPERLRLARARGLNAGLERAWLLVLGELWPEKVDKEEMIDRIGDPR